MSERCHLEIDDTPMYTEKDDALNRSIIGCSIWRVALGRFDIAYATSGMNRFNMLPREGHLNSAKRILAYLKTFPKDRIINDTKSTNCSIYPIEDYPT
jgi:hypothetical protein